ncbi:chromosomal replication initiator protein DnaA, partial [Bacillus sp. HMF5848]|uniref:DnaA N-terminal domain-containing protein n=1 Tax=Bacillus sp. HMF5848 TaxID=2495421 RepID=UPI000FA58616
MENIADLWKEALKRLKKKVSKPSYDTWLQATTAHALQNDVLIISAPNEFARDWLENRYSKIIGETIYDITGEELTIKFIIPKDPHEEDFSIKTPVKKPVQMGDETNDTYQS